MSVQLSIFRFKWGEMSKLNTYIVWFAGDYWQLVSFSLCHWSVFIVVTFVFNKLTTLMSLYKMYHKWNTAISNSDRYQYQIAHLKNNLESVLLFSKNKLVFLLHFTFHILLFVIFNSYLIQVSCLQMYLIDCMGQVTYQPLHKSFF